jgi:tetratricopeptide (TPR) repeat protein
MYNFSPQVKRVGQSSDEEIKLAFALVKEKRFDEALEAFKKVLRTDPGAKKAHFGAGSMLVRQGRYDEALTHFQEVMRLDPLMPKAHLAAGRVYLKQGDLQKAIEAFQDALNIEASPQAYMSIGQVLMRQKNYDEAVQELRKALRLDPQLVAARTLLAQAYQKQGNLATAVSELKSALNINPTAWRTYEIVGRIYVQQKEYGAARQAFEAALKYNPELSNASRLGLIEALIEENQLDEASEMLKEIPKLKALEPKKHKLWGDLYQRQGLLKEAAEEYRAATLLAAEEGDTLDDLSDLDALLEDEERWQEVIEPYRAAANRQVSEAANRRVSEAKNRQGANSQKRRRER